MRGAGVWPALRRARFGSNPCSPGLEAPRGHRHQGGNLRPSGRKQPHLGSAPFPHPEHHSRDFPLILDLHLNPRWNFRPSTLQLPQASNTSVAGPNETVGTNETNGTYFLIY